MCARNYSWAVGAAALAAMVICIGCGPAPAEKPAAYERWEAKDGSFAIDYPQNWESKGGGKHGIQWARFSSGGAEVDIDTNLSDSLMTEGADLAMGDTELTQEEKDELHAINGIHAQQVDMRKEEMSGYEEQKAVAMRTGLGETRKGEFSATAGLGGKIKGYHVTVLGHNKRVTVICKCSASDWKMLQPEFDKMIDSLGN